MSIVMMMTWAGKYDVHLPNAWRPLLPHGMKCWENFTPSYRQLLSAALRVFALITMRRNVACNMYTCMIVQLEKIILFLICYLLSSSPLPVPCRCSRAIVVMCFCNVRSLVQENTKHFYLLRHWQVGASIDHKHQTWYYLLQQGWSSGYKRYWLVWI